MGSAYNEYHLDLFQVTYPDPAGFITGENGCDERDATTYKFNLTVCNVSQVRRLALEVRGRKFESCHTDQYCPFRIMDNTLGYEPGNGGSIPSGGTSYVRD